VTIDKTEHDKYIATADLRYASKDFLGAINDYTEALKQFSSARAFTKRGNAKMNLLDFEGSILDFDKAIELDRNFGNPYYLRFIAKAFLSDYAGGRDDIKTAKELDQENSWTYHTFSMFLLENPDIDINNDLKKDFITKACPLIA